MKMKKSNHFKYQSTEVPKNEVPKYCAIFRTKGVISNSWWFLFESVLELLLQTALSRQVLIYPLLTLMSFLLSVGY